MNVIAIIPARMQATRFPGKPMASIHGVPMIGHVFERTRLCKRLTDVYIATCDREIFDYIRSIGGKAVMTHDRHERCTDRTAEAMLKIEQERGGKIDIVVMVQGDEPMVFPEQIDECVRVMTSDSSLNMLCMMAPLPTDEAFEDPNQVKVVVDLQGFALYFSREPIPSRKKGGKNLPRFKQVPLIPFRRDYLLKFNAMTPTPLEAIESVDLLRVLEHGDKVKMIETRASTLSVDTPKDLERVEAAMKSDALMKTYLKAAAR